MRRDLQNASKAIPEELIQLAVKVPSGTTYFADVLGLAGDQVDTRFDREAMPSLAVGQGITLAFRSPRFQKPVELKATVVRREESLAARGYGFCFDKTPEMPGRLQMIYALINQRHAHRVKPRMAESVDVLLELPEDLAPASRNGPRSAKTVLRDISLSGLSVLVHAEVEAAFASTELIRTTLHLPNYPAPVSLMSWIRNRRLQEKSVIYGLEFDPEESDQFDQRHRYVVEYVMRRQRDELRVRSSRGG